MAESLIDFLSKIDMFSLLTRDEIKSFIDILDVINLKEGETLFSQGDTGDQLYIVKTGKIAITIKLPNGTEKEITQLSEGEFFGEMSIFEKAPRSASCTVREDSSLISLKGEEFLKLIQSNPTISIKIMYKMINKTTYRLLNASKFLSDMVHWGEEARRRAITDDLTGLYNRRYLDDALPDLFDKAKISNTNLSVIMIDMDHFRDINESYGDKVGDESIKVVSEVFKKDFSEKDVVSRYGGDEFTVLIPDRKIEDLRELVAKICKDVSATTFLEKFNGPVKKLSLSMGVATFPDNAKTLAELSEKADKSLYRAKEGGRNRAVFFDDK